MFPAAENLSDAISWFFKLLVSARVSRKKNLKDREYWNNAIQQLDYLIFMYHHTQQPQNTHAFVHGIVAKTEYMLDHNMYLNKFKKIEILQNF